MVNFSVVLAVSASIFQASSTMARNIEYDCNETPEICLNTCWAVNCAGHPSTLHGAGQADAKASKKYGKNNRNSWGYNSKPCNNGWGWTTGSGKSADSPDEYPYASSSEGGLSYNGRSVTLRCVPNDQQHKQGGKVSGIGTDATTSGWTTTWTNIKGLSQDWCASGRTCNNDGHQFTSQGKNGPFVKREDGEDDRNTTFVLAENPKVLPRGMTDYSADGNSVTYRAPVPVAFEA